MDVVLVTGGTGHLGRDVVRLLRERDYQVRVLARQPGDDPDVQWVRGDLATGAGLTDAVAGVNTVVHAATDSPAAQRGRFGLGDFVRTPDDVDLHGTRLLAQQARLAGVGHFVQVSIVGAREARVPYLRVKAAAEREVRASGVPYSIVAATPFYWLLARMYESMARGPVWLAPSNVILAPGDSTEFASYLVESVMDGPRGDRECFSGPEELSMLELARQYQQARGGGRVVPVRLPAMARRAMGPQTCPDGRHGEIRWTDWLDVRRRVAIVAG